MKISFTKNNCSPELICKTSIIENNVDDTPCIYIKKNNIYINKFILYYRSIKFIQKYNNNAEYSKCFSFFTLLSCYRSAYCIKKNITNKSKTRNYVLINKLYNVYNIYIYFIYNKYYNTYCKCKNYHYLCFSISDKKLFNCRDFYKIYSFI
jgi:hypothetical protein